MAFIVVIAPVPLHAFAAEISDHLLGGERAISDTIRNSHTPVG
jgi:hypothetical protein